MLPPTVDLRPEFERWGLPPRRQGARGTCSVFTVTGALELAIARKRRRGERLSVEFLNWAGHEAVGRTTDGGFFSDMWKGFEKHGLCAEGDWPYQGAFDPNAPPPPAAVRSAAPARRLTLALHWIKEWNPKTGLTDEQIAQIKDRLARKSPVCGGFRWPKSAKWVDATLQMCPASEVFDGHSVLLVGYRDDAFLIRNSGGDGSDGWIPIVYAKEYMNDACWIG